MTCIDALLSIGTSIIATIIITYIYNERDNHRYKRQLKDKYDGAEFEVYWKEFPDNPKYLVRCSVDKNIIRYTPISNCIEIGISIGNSEGEFIMDARNLRIGKGYYIHNNFNGYNFPEIIIKDEDTFFIQTLFVKIELQHSQENQTTQDYYGRAHYQAFVWRRIKKQSFRSSKLKQFYNHLLDRIYN